MPEWSSSNIFLLRYITVFLHSGPLDILNSEITNKKHRNEKTALNIIKSRLVYGMKTEKKELPLKPQLGTCTSDDSAFLPLCTYLQQKSGEYCFGVINTFLWVGEFANMKSTNKDCVHGKISLLLATQF